MYLLETIGFTDMETCTKPVKLKTNTINTMCNMRERYLLIEWPESQAFMDHPRWGECILCVEIEGHPCPDGTYAVPESLYEEVFS